MLPGTEVSALFVSCYLRAGFLFLHFALLQNELCKVAPWEGIGIAHLIKELREINAPLLGVPVSVYRRMHAQYMCLCWCVHEM